jgi:hypothetical protein
MSSKFTSLTSATVTGWLSVQYLCIASGSAHGFRCDVEYTGFKRVHRGLPKSRKQLQSEAATTTAAMTQTLSDSLRIFDRLGSHQISRMLVHRRYIAVDRVEDENGVILWLSRSEGVYPCSSICL